MNALTRRLVTETAKANKAAARENGQRFADLVSEAWWTYILGKYGWRIQQKLLAMARIECPKMFDEDGDLLNYIPWISDWEFSLSDRIVQRLGERAERDPELRLDDWGDLPRRIAEPQMELF